MKKTVLIVDDEKDIRESVGKILKEEGFKVVKAKNADECIEFFKQDKASLVLMDIMMPGTPVKDVIPKLPAKVVYITAVQTTDAEKEELLSLKNVAGFIQKPFDLDELIKIVKKAVK